MGNRSKRGDRVAWRPWMEDPDHLRRPRPAYARPAGLGSLGSESYFAEPYRIRSPHRVHIGDNVGIGARSFLSVVEFGDRTGFSVGVFVGDAGRGYEDPDASTADMVIDAPSRRIRIGSNVLLGARAMVLAGVTIGDRAFIGAGAVVTRDIPPRSVVLGNPGRIIRRWDEQRGQWRIGG